MTKKNALIAVFTILAVVALVSLAMYACPFYAGFKPGKIFMEKMDAKQQQLYRDLNLTKEQKKLLEENKNKNREQMKELFHNMRIGMILMRQELQKDQLDMGKINQINNELKQLQAQMLDYRLQSILEVRKILTPEQFKKFEAKMEERTSHFRDKRERPREEF